MKYIGYYIVDNKNQVLEVFDYISNAEKFIKDLPDYLENRKVKIEKRICFILVFAIIIPQ